LHQNAFPPEENADVCCSGSESGVEISPATPTLGEDPSNNECNLTGAVARRQAPHAHFLRLCIEARKPVTGT
jgi:hypothetical protein